MIDNKFERYKLLTEVGYAESGSSKATMLLLEYAQICTLDILHDRRGETKWRHLMFWFQKHISSLGMTKLPEEVLQEAVARTRRDVEDLMWSRQQIFRVIHSLPEETWNDLDQITDFYRAHRLFPK